MSLLIISMKSCLFTFGREKNRMSRSQNFDSAGILRITLYRSCSVIFFMTRMRCLIVMAYGIINNNKNKNRFRSNMYMYKSCTWTMK